MEGSWQAFLHRETVTQDRTDYSATHLRAKDALAKVTNGPAHTAAQFSPYRAQLSIPGSSSNVSLP